MVAISSSFPRPRPILPPLVLIGGILAGLGWRIRGGSLDSTVQSLGLPLAAFSLAAAILALIRSREAPAEAWGWRWLALASAATIVTGLQLGLGHRNPALSEAHSGLWFVLSGIQQVSSLAAVLAWPFRPRSQLRLGMHVLGSILLCGSILLLLWGLADWQIIGVGSYPLPPILITSSLRVCLLGGFTLYLISDRPRRWDGPLSWMLLNAVGVALVLGLYALADRQHQTWVRPLLVFCLAAPITVLMAAWSRRPAEPPLEPAEHPSQVWELVPYAPFGCATVLVALHALLGQGRPRAEIPALIALMLVLIVRQILLFREVRRANVELESKVLERTRALDGASAMARHELEEQHQLGALQAALYRIAMATLETPSLQDLFARIHGILSELIPARNFYVAVVDEATGLTTFPYFVDERDLRPPPRKPGGNTLTDLVLSTGQAQLFTGSMLKALATEQGVRIHGTYPVDWLGVPLVIQGVTLGMMAVQSYAEEVRYTEKSVQLLQFVATQVASSIHRKQAEEALRTSEEKFFKVFHAAPLLVALSHLADGRLVEVNDLYCQALGFTRGELIGHSTLELGIFSPEIRARMTGIVRSGGSVRNLEMTMVAKDGRSIPSLLSGEVVEVDGQRLFLSMFVDITELKQAEQARLVLQAEVDHMQKLDSLGRLAGGIAHDMNNVLGAIFAVTQTIRLRYGENRELDQALGTVERAATRGRDLVKGLVGFTRKELAAPASIDLNDLVRQEMDLLEHTLLQKYRLVMDLEEPLPVILGEIGPLGSALMNLCVNAVDAMPGGGTLTIRTRRLPGALVELAVEDTGEGMAPEVLKMAMEPFFTTKPQGKGTGLGLATAFNTVRAHGGVLTLHSAEGQGTRVLMRLPCIVTGATSADIPDALPAPRSLNILLVDDDELLRASVPSLLGMLGHRVEAVDGGRSAMDRLIGGGLWDLVILDMNMPEMSGLETLRQIRALWPRLPVLLATGFLGSDGEAAVAADPYTFAITKPFSLDEIQQKLAHMAA